MSDLEWAAETWRKRCGWFLYSYFRARDFRRVAAHEVIHCQVRAERTDWREHTEGITGQKNHVSRMSSHARDQAIADEIDGISAACVLRNARVGVIDAVVFFENNILQNRTETQSRKDIRLGFARQIDRFRVASALDIEDAVVAPAVLVVSYQIALGISGKGGLSRTTQPKEQGGTPRLLICSCRAVHREHAASRRKEIGCCKDPSSSFLPHIRFLESPVLVLPDSGDFGHQPIRRKGAGVVDKKIRLAK